MARSTLAPVVSSLAGAALAPTAADAAGSQWTYGGGKRHLLVINDGAVSVDVTISVPLTIDGDLDVPDRVVSVAAGGMASVRESHSQRQADGTVLVDYSATADVSVVLLETD